MNPAAHDQESFESALQMLLTQQRDAMRTILALSDKSHGHDVESARAALSEIFHAADKCHATYRAMLAEILAAKPERPDSRRT